MSKINIEIDTADHTLTCELDGKKIPGVCSVSAWCGENYDGEPVVSVDVGIEAEKLGDGVKRYSRIVTADHKDRDKTATASTSPDGTLVFISDESKLAKSITQLLGR